MTKILIVSDSHAGVDDIATNFRRFHALGNFIVEHRPDVFIHLGDTISLDSCSTYDLPQNRPTLAEEVAVAREAHRAMFSPLWHYDRRRRSQKKRQARMHSVFCAGNHEERIEKEIKAQSVTLGSVVEARELFGWDNYFDTIVPYREYYTIDDIAFTHTPMNRLGKPLTNIYRGRSIAMQSDYNVVYGHSHTMDFTVLPLTPVHGNNLRWTFNVPAFMDPGHIESYARGSLTGWTYGVVMLDTDAGADIPQLTYYPMEKVLEYFC